MSKAKTEQLNKLRREMTQTAYNSTINSPWQEWVFEEYRISFDIIRYETHHAYRFRATTALGATVCQDDTIQETLEAISRAVSKIIIDDREWTIWRELDNETLKYAIETNGPKEVSICRFWIHGTLAELAQDAMDDPETIGFLLDALYDRNLISWV